MHSGNGVIQDSVRWKILMITIPPNVCKDQLISTFHKMHWENIWTQSYFRLTVKVKPFVRTIQLYSHETKSMKGDLNQQDVT